MEEGLHVIKRYIEELTYPRIFLILLTGKGLSFPEEVILVFSGYIAFPENSHFSYASLIGFLVSLLVIMIPILLF